MNRQPAASCIKLQRESIELSYVSHWCYLAIADRHLITVYNRVKIAALARYEVGDPVHVSKFKTVFEKGYTPN